MPGQHVKLTEEGKRAFSEALSHSAQAAAFFGVPQDELMFGARFYQCLHCGTRYESLPACQGAVKCRQCGSTSVREE